MTSVDNKVVSITFDNKAFSDRIQETIGALEKLRGSLNLSGATKGISELSAAAKSLDMTPMATSIEGINAKFAAMAAVGITAIANLTNRIVDAGLQIGKAFALTPVTEGFAEFELKMGSVQTIMAGSGESMEVVNKKLQELNDYSDQTIYSFKDMTSNIGKFTNAGVDLDRATAAIKGVANVAALSGANAEEASRSMFNFSQAIGTGVLRLEDWRSIELANMATSEFKQQLIDSGVAMGTLTKAADGTIRTLKGTIVTADNFRGTLTEQWLTADALTDTLNRYADTTTDVGARATAAAQDIKTFGMLIGTIKESLASGWAQSFELLIGNFEQGKKLFGIINAAVSGIIGQSADARNKMLSDWQDLGGWDEMLAGIIHFYQGVKSFILPIREAFREIFPRTTGQDLFNLTKSFREFAEGMRASGETAARIKGFFRGLFGVLSIVWEVAKGVARVFFALAGAAIRIVAPLLKLVGNTGALGSGLHGLLVESGGIRKFFDFLVAAITKTSEVIATVVNFFVELVLGLGLVTKLGGPIKSVFGAIFGFISNLGVVGAAGGFFGDLAQKVGNFLSKLNLLGAAGSVISAIGAAFTEVKDALGDFFSNIDFMPFMAEVSRFGYKVRLAVLDLADGLASAGKAVGDFFGRLDFGPVLDFLGRAISNVGDAIEGFFGLFGGGRRGEEMEEAGTAAARMGRSIVLASDGAEKGVSIFKRLADTISDFLGTVFSGGGDFFDKLVSGLGGIGSAIISAIGDAFSGANLNTLLDIIKTGALGGMALYIVNFFRNVVSFGDLVKQIKKGIADTIDALTGSLKALQTNIKADTLRKIAIAVGILAISMVALSLIDPAALTQGLVGMSVGLGALVAAMAALNKMDFGGGSGFFGQMGSSAKIASIGTAMIGMATAMAILAAAVYLFSRMDMGDMMRGLLGVSLGLTVMSTAIRIIGNNTEGIVRASIAMGIMAGAMLLLAVAIERFAKIPFGDMLQGTFQMAFALALLVEALNQLPNDMMDKGVGVLILALGLDQLAKVVRTFDSIPWPALIKGVIGIAGSLRLIGAALDAFPKDIRKLSFDLLLLNLAMFALSKVIQDLGSASAADIAKGVIGLTVMLNSLAGSMRLFEKSKGGTPAILGASVAMLALGNAVKIVGSMPFGDVIKGVAGLVVALAAVGGVAYFVAAPLNALGLAFALIGGGLLAAGAGAYLFASAFKMASDVTESGVDNLIKGIEKFLQALPGFGVKLIEGFIMAFMELGNRASDLIQPVENVLQAIIDSLYRLVPEFIKLGGEILDSFLMEIMTRAPDLVETGLEMLLQILEGIRRNIRDIIEVIAEIIINAFDALEEKAPDVIESLFNFLTTVLEETAYRLGEGAAFMMLGVGRALFEGLIAGIIEQTTKIGELLKPVIDAIIGWFKSLFGIQSPSTVMMEIGRFVIEGLWQGLLAALDLIKTFFIDLPLKVLGWIGDAVVWLVQKGWDVIQGFINGYVNAITAVTEFFTGLAGKILGWIGSLIKTLYNTGKDLIKGLKDGIEWVWESVTNFFTSIPRKIKEFIGDAGKILFEIGKDIIGGLKKGIEAAMGGLGDVVGGIGGFITGLKGPPSYDKVMLVPQGQWIMQGLIKGIKSQFSPLGKTVSEVSPLIAKNIQSATQKALDVIADMGEFNPTITPVLDLSRVEADSRRIGSLVAVGNLNARGSYGLAATIARASRASERSDQVATTPQAPEVTFVQNNYSPESLSTADIYRNTKSQIALAKEELGIR